MSEQGWTLTELERSSYIEQVVKSAKASVVDSDTAKSMAQFQHERSVGLFRSNDSDGQSKTV